jgi:hypothetical protein
MANYDAFDKQILEATRELEKLKSQMETTRHEFMVIATDYLKPRYMKIVSRLIRDKSHLAAALSDEQLKSLKLSVKSLEESSKEIIEEEFSNPALWWHLRDKECIDKYHDYHKIWDFKAAEIPTLIKKALKYAVGKIGPSLSELGFARLNDGHSVRGNDYIPIWKNDDRPGNPDIYIRSAPFYPHDLPWDESLRSSIEKYNDLLDETTVILSTLNQLKRQKSEVQASDRWESL